MSRSLRIHTLVGVAGLLGWAGLAAASSSIGGTVFERKGERLTALARAFVSVRTSNGAVLGTTRTDRNGRYQLIGLPLGRFRLTASKPGYQTRLAAGRAGSRIVIDCSAGCTEPAADFELFRGAVITGAVVDRMQEPIDRARVSVRRTDSSSGGDPTGHDTTDDRGRFRIAGLQPGAHTLRVQGRAPGRGPEISTRTLQLGEGEEIENLTVVLGAQGTFRVAGRLAGVPIGEGYRTWITARPVGGGRRGISARVAHDGSFEFASVAPGRYRATAFASKRGSGNRTDYHLDVVEVRSDLGGITLQPLETASIAGNVEVVAGALPPRAIVQLTSNEGFGYDWFRISRINRQFELSGLVPGSYRLHSRSGQFYVKGIKTDDRIEPADEVVLSPGTNRLTVVVAADHGQVYGTIRDPNTREPLPHARVALDGDRGKLLAQADQAGRFLFGKVIPGEYRICAWADIPPEDVEREASWEKAGCEFKIIPIDAQSEIEIDLRAAQ